MFPENWLKSKLITGAAISVCLSPLIKWIEIYVFSDWQFLNFLLVIICLDTALGVWAAIRGFRVSSYAFSAIFKKLIIYFTILVLIHILCHFIMVREGWSIGENLNLIRPGLFPKWLSQHLADKFKGS
ncbi:MAG: phage holin family protein [Bacteroidota bacterium]